MTFANLSVDIQNIMQYQYETSVKAIFIFSLIVFSLVYLFYWKKYKERETAFYTVATLRIIFSITCWAVLLASPMLLFMLSPTFTFDVFQKVFYYFYFSYLIIGAMLLLIDFMYFLPVYFVQLAGAKSEDRKMTLFIRQLKEWSKKHS